MSWRWSWLSMNGTGWLYLRNPTQLAQRPAQPEAAPGPAEDDWPITVTFCQLISSELVAPLEHLPKVFQNGPLVPKRLLHSFTHLTKDNWI